MSQDVQCKPGLGCKCLKVEHRLYTYRPNWFPNCHLEGDPSAELPAGLLGQKVDLHDNACASNPVAACALGGASGLGAKGDQARLDYWKPFHALSFYVVYWRLFWA